MSVDQEDGRTALQAAIDEMVEDGTLVVTQEIDPDTGTFRNRYFHRDHAPTAN